jgi:uncharacterized protein involved in outer membrane biogenesis
MSGFFRWTIRILIFLTLVLVSGIAILALVRIPIDLTPHKKIIETIVSRAIERPVAIDTAIEVTTSLNPVFTIKGLRIKNPQDFDNRDFASLKSCRLDIQLLPLLAQKLHINRFMVKGFSLYLREKEGRVNWTFSKEPPLQGGEQVKPAEKSDREALNLRSDSLVITDISLDQISVSYQSGKNLSDAFFIDRCTGSALANTPFKLTMAGKVLEEPYTASIEAASLQEFLDHNRSWTRIQIEMAQALFDLEGNINLITANRQLDLKAMVKGERLDHFNRLLDLDLPPLPLYQAGGHLILSKDQVRLSQLELLVNQSRLTGEMRADLSGPVPLVTMALTSPLIQLDDFLFDDWSPRDVDPEKQQEDKPITKTSTDKASQQLNTAAELFSPEALNRLGLDLTITAEQVKSGKDTLGDGNLSFKIKEGRITLDPLVLNLPGGSLDVAMSIKPDPEKSQAWVMAKIKNFDIGILVHRAAPDSDMGGRFNLDLYLKTQASTLKDILANGNGHFDFSAQPENLRAGILDLWAINLVMAAVARSDKHQSQIECLIGRWSMKEGYLTPEAFVVDTSRMRICGNGWVDFKKETVDLKVAPIPKKPAFFSLATPIGIQGKFEDFYLGIVPGGVVGTSLRFITSPIHVPIAWLARVKLPADGSDVCHGTLGAENRPAQQPAGCRGFYR